MEARWWKAFVLAVPASVALFGVLYSPADQNGGGTPRSVPGRPEIILDAHPAGPTEVHERPSQAEESSRSTLEPETTDSHAQSGAEPALPGRTDDHPRAQNDSGWLYQVVVAEDWTDPSCERLRQIFLRPPDRHSWEMALWAIRRCPAPAVSDWLEEFVRGPAPIRDREQALLVVAELRTAGALGVLQRSSAWVEEPVRRAAARALERRAEWDPLAQELVGVRK